MSYRDDKLEEARAHDKTSMLARRPLKSFIRGPGYRFEVLEPQGTSPTLLAYQEADERTVWRRVRGVDGDWFEIIPQMTTKQNLARDDNE